jgi:hypothetical protein
LYGYNQPSINTPPKTKTKTGNITWSRSLGLTTGTNAVARGTYITDFMYTNMCVSVYIYLCVYVYMCVHVSQQYFGSTHASVALSHTYTHMYTIHTHTHTPKKKHTVAVDPLNGASLYITGAFISTEAYAMAGLTPPPLDATTDPVRGAIPSLLKVGEGRSGWF